MKKMDGIEELWRFALNIDNHLRQNQPIMIQHQEANVIFNLITRVADAVKDEQGMVNLNFHGISG